eukprot:jgi/Psemu1/53334/gm1.53334_g
MVVNSPLSPYHRPGRDTVDSDVSLHLQARKHQQRVDLQLTSPIWVSTPRIRTPSVSRTGQSNNRQVASRFPSSRYGRREANLGYYRSAPPLIVNAPLLGAARRIRMDYSKRPIPATIRTKLPTIRSSNQPVDSNTDYSDHQLQHADLHRVLPEHPQSPWSGTRPGPGLPNHL